MATPQGQAEAKGTSWAIEPPAEPAKREVTATEVQIVSFQQLRDINAKQSKIIEQNDMIIALLTKISTMQPASVSQPVVPKIPPLEKVKAAITKEDKDGVLADKVVVKDEGDFIIVRTNGFISKGFDILGRAMRSLNADYDNADKKNTFWKISKATLA